MKTSIPPIKKNSDLLYRFHSEDYKLEILDNIELNNQLQANICIPYFEEIFKVSINRTSLKRNKRKRKKYQGIYF